MHKNKKRRVFLIHEVLKTMKSDKFCFRFRQIALRRTACASKTRVPKRFNDELEQKNHFQRRQKLGTSKTSTVNSSSLPSSIAKESTHFAPFGKEA